MTALVPARDAGWTRQIRVASALTALCGLWLIVSPLVFGPGFRRGAVVNDPIVGVIVALLALYRFASPPTTVWPSWATIPFGVWTIISPWTYGFAAQGRVLEYDSVALGIIIVALSLWAALAGGEVEDIHRLSLG